MRRRTLAGIVGVAITAMLLASCAQGAQPSMGRPAPDIALPSLDGTTIRLADLRGQVVLVNFWGTYCPPCTEEMPALQRLYERYANEGFVVLAIDVEEPPEVVEAFRERHGITFPIALSDDASINPAYRLHALPTSWLVDRQGIVRAIWIGPLDPDRVEGEIARWLQRAAP